MKLIFVYGLPGVGKLTVARELSKLTGYRLFHVHLLADMLESVFGFDSDGFRELFHSMWPAVVQRAAEEDLPGLITTFVFTRTMRLGMVLSAADAVRLGGGDVLFVELRCDRPELERRMLSPDRRGFAKITSVEVLNELIDGGELAVPQLPGARLVLDTTEQIAAETARSILESLPDVRQA